MRRLEGAEAAEAHARRREAAFVGLPRVRRLRAAGSPGGKPPRTAGTSVVPTNASPEMDITLGAMIKAVR